MVPTDRVIQLLEDCREDDQPAFALTRDLEENFLLGLRESLAGRVVSAEFVTAEDGPLCLKVVAKGSEALGAVIWVALADQAWWFYWGRQWAERIGRANDPDGAAATVLATLRSER